MKWPDSTKLIDLLQQTAGQPAGQPCLPSCSKHYSIPLMACCVFVTHACVCYSIQRTFWAQVSWFTQ